MLLKMRGSRPPWSAPGRHVDCRKSLVGKPWSIVTRWDLLNAVHAKLNACRSRVMLEMNRAAVRLLVMVAGQLCVRPSAVPVGTHV